MTTVEVYYRLYEQAESQATFWERVFRGSEDIITRWQVSGRDARRRLNQYPLDSDTSVRLLSGARVRAGRFSLRCSRNGGLDLGRFVSNLGAEGHPLSRFKLKYWIFRGMPPYIYRLVEYWG